MGDDDGFSGKGEIVEALFVAAAGVDEEEVVKQDGVGLIHYC